MGSPMCPLSLFFLYILVKATSGEIVMTSEPVYLRISRRHSHHLMYIQLQYLL
ncbi:hypothetical protein GDO81_000028 [Engystomops pustulosus]|uniref:Uncharacterized protein n=1 Tax=Engystomops pustulosus TaxID=76066 RepID=A0AAV7D2D4_ENGPU|nr:hypothetical protein GDO81_000028 [Engystomops pustulosus]